MVGVIRKEEEKGDDKRAKKRQFFIFSFRARLLLHLARASRTFSRQHWKITCSFCSRYLY